MEQDTTAGAEPRLSRAEREENAILKKIDSIRELRGADFDEIDAYVYRQSWGDGGNISLPKLHQILEDYDLGMIYGPGKYLVTYVYTDAAGETKKKQIKYNLGAEFAEVHRKYCAENGLPCYLRNDTLIPGQSQSLPAPAGLKLGDLLNKEKLEGLIMLAGTLKQFLGGSNDKLIEMQSKMIQGMMTQQQPPIMNEIMGAAVKNLLNPPRPAAAQAAAGPLAGVREQLSLFNELRETFAPESAPAAAEGGTMSRIVEMVLPMLPALLEKFGGNIEAAAAAQMKNPIVKSYLKDTKTQKELFQAIAQQQGIEAAKSWAAGFGLDPAQFAPRGPAKAAAPMVGEVIL